VDGSVALVKIGAGASLDTVNVDEPILGFILTNAGLMYNATLEGSKYTKLVR
jgi:lipid-binding SYLF domain-containing protein